MATIDIKNGHENQNGSIGQLSFASSSFDDQTAVIYNADAIVNAYNKMADKLEKIRAEFEKIQKAFKKARNNGSSKGKELKKTSHYNSSKAQLQDEIILISNRLDKRVGILSEKISRLRSDAATIDQLVSTMTDYLAAQGRGMNQNASKDAAEQSGGY